MTWEAAADDHGHWRSVVKAVMGRGEDTRYVHKDEKMEKREATIVKRYPVPTLLNQLSISATNAT